MACEPNINGHVRSRPERQARLFNNIMEEESEDDSISTTSCDANTNMENFISDTKEGDEGLIFRRLRPVDAMSRSYNIKPSNKTQNTSQNRNIMEKPFSYSEMFKNIFMIYSNNIYLQPMINVKESILTEDNWIKETRFSRVLRKTYGNASHLYENMRDIIKSEQRFETTELAHIPVLIWVSFSEICNEYFYELLTLPQSENQFRKAETT